MLRLMLDEIQEGVSTLDIECSPEEIDLEFDGVAFVGKVSIKPSIVRQASKIYIKSIIWTNIEMECCRCLEPVSVRLDAISEIQYLPLPKLVKDRIDDIGIGYYSEEYIDISDEVRESLILEIPMTVLCSENCKGLCPHCGKNLNFGKCDCSEPNYLKEANSPVILRLLELKRKLEV